jgi:hypothetical protein
MDAAHAHGSRRRRKSRAKPARSATEGAASDTERRGRAQLMSPEGRNSQPLACARRQQLATGPLDELWISHTTAELLPIHSRIQDVDRINPANLGRRVTRSVLAALQDDLGGRASAVSTPIGVRKLERLRSQSLTSRSPLPYVRPQQASCCLGTRR